MVDRLQWDRSVSSDAFIRRLYSEGRPVILYDTPASDWPAMKQWSPEWLVENIGGHTKFECFYMKNNSGYLYYNRKKAKPWGKAYKQPISAREQRMQ